MVDKNKAVLEFLGQCPSIASNPLFFNFINAKDDNKQFITVTNDVLIHTPFIDGSVQKRYTFTLVDYKSVSYNALVAVSGYSDENVEEMFEVQNILDWVEEQAEARNYPDFGSDCYIDAMYTLSDNPNLNGVDTSIQPALAKYSISIQIDYIDRSKMIWNY